MIAPLFLFVVATNADQGAIKPPDEAPDSEIVNDLDDFDDFDDFNVDRRRRLSERRHLRRCRTLQGLIPEQYEMSLEDNENGKVVVATNQGDTNTQSLEVIPSKDVRDSLSGNLLTVALLVKKLVSKVRTAVASLTISEIAQQMVDKGVTAKLQELFDMIKRGSVGMDLSSQSGREPSFEDASPEVTSLNSGLFVLTLGHVLQGMPPTHGDPRALSNVQYAIGLQMYVNLAGSALFVAADVVKFGYLVKLGMAQGVLKPVEETLSTLQSTFEAIGAVELVAGGILALVNIGFDIYELTEARNQIERSMAINQLVFDSTGVALIGSTLVLAQIGAVGASQAIGAFFVPLAGIGIGITALVGAFAKIGLEAGQVGLYFGKFREGFVDGAYHLENNSYVPNPYSVIEKIDFQSQTVSMGSPYLSKSSHGSTGSGRSNYFFWVGDQPYCNLKELMYNGKLDPNTEWRRDVFDIRARMEQNGCAQCTTSQRLPAQSVNQGTHNLPSVFILPMSPRSVISYSYFQLPGATTRQDYGFQILRDLEGSDFDFDFYVFPSECIIHRMHRYFLDTNVTLVMDDVHRVLTAPKHQRGTTNAWNKLSYHIVGSTSMTDIFLQYGVNFVLTSPTDNTSVSFMLDSTLMDEQQDAIIRDKKIRFDDLSIDYSALPVGSIVYLRSNESLRQLDIAENVFLTESVNVISNGSLKDITHQLGNLARAHRTAGRFVGVGGSIEGIEGLIVYDSQEDILVYTSDPTPLDTILLGVQSKGFGCFASPSQCRVWCTNLVTHEAIFETKSFCSDTSDFALGGFMFVAEKLAIMEITRSGKLPSKKCSVHYRYLLSENDCSLVDIRLFAPIDNISEDLHSALDALPQGVDAPLKIGTSKQQIVSARVANWVTYERLLFDASGERRAQVFNQRSWYHWSTETTIILETSKIHISLENLTFMHLVIPKVSSRQKEADILFHDSSSAQVFRYEPTSNGQGSGTLVLLRADVATVAQSGTAWFGVSSYGSVVEFLSAQSFRIIGYTYNVFDQTHIRWADWWNELRDEDKASAPIIPFYQVKSGIIKATRSWYLREAKSYVILDPHFNENGTVNCVGVTENKADALLVTGTGVMWAAGVLQASDIADPFVNWKPKMAPVEWTPSGQIQSKDKIVSAQWAPGGTTIETETGLVILAHNLTTNSAAFALRGLRVSDDEHNAKLVYHFAKHLQLQMPTVNFLPVRLGARQAYLFNVKDSANIRLFVPTHQGVPLGLDNINSRMAFFDAANRVLWSDNVQLRSTFDFAVRFGNVLLVTSSEERVLIPNLYGVNNIAIELKSGVKKLTIPLSNEVNEVAVDTTNMLQTDVIEVQVPWKAEELVPSALHDVGNVNKTLQIVVSHVAGKTLRWQGLSGQRLITTFARTAEEPVKAHPYCADWMDLGHCSDLVRRSIMLQLCPNYCHKFGAQCPHADCIPEWKYMGARKPPCSNPNNDRKGMWCPTSLSHGDYAVGIDEFKYCRPCAEEPVHAYHQCADWMARGYCSDLVLRAIMLQLCPNDCHKFGAKCPLDECITEWSYNGVQQLPCDNPDNSRDLWCPTELENGNYRVGSGKFKYCLPCGPVYNDLGVGKCALQVGTKVEQIHADWNGGQGRNCENLCNAKQECGGYSVSADHCLLYFALRANLILSNVLWGSSSCMVKGGQMCPVSHRYAFHGGDYCCKHNQEKVHTPSGDSCDGSEIETSSTCCLDDEYMDCPSPPCSSRSYCSAAPSGCATMCTVEDEKKTAGIEDNSWVGYDWNDKVGAINVKEGCTFTAYEDWNYEGRSEQFTGGFHNDGDMLSHRLLSSFKCSCPSNL